MGARLKKRAGCASYLNALLDGMEQYVTVVYKVNDNEAFKPEFDKIHKKMLEDDSQPWRVTAVSLDDEMHRVELLEEALQSDDPGELCFNIVSSSGVWRKTLADFAD